VKHKDPIDAVPYLQKILMIDRERHDISDRIKQLYVMDEKHRSRRRSMFMTFAALICFVAIGAFYFLYEQNVRRVFDSLDPVPYVKEGDFDGAIAMYQEFLRRYPITVLRSEVEAKIEQLQGRQALDLAHREQVSRVAQRRAMRKRREYRELYDEYVESFEKEKDLAKALLRLQRIIVLVEEAGEPEDGDFRRTMKLDAALDETKTLLEDGERLEQEIKKKLDEGDAETARKLALQMHRDFRFTPSARRTLVPIELHSEPSGAQVYRDGKPILNGDKPLVTPVLLEVPFNDRVEIQLIKKGFKQLTVSMKGSDPSPLVVAMPLKPEIVVKLEWETMTGVSLAGDIGLVGLRDGKLVGFDPRTGSQKFSLDLDVLEEVKQAPVVYEGLCVFPTTQSNLIAVSTKTGEELWRSRIEGGVENELRLRPQGNTVAFVTGSGELRVHSVTTGKLVWAYDTGKSPAASPRWDGENLLYGDGSDQLLVLSLDGQVSTQIGVSGFTVSGTPLRTHGLFVVGGTDGRVHAVNEWGTEVWSKKIGKPYSPITILEVQDGLLVLDEEGLIRKLSAKTGKFLRARRLSGPVTDLIQVKNRIYILSESDNAARIVGIDGRQLAMLWEYKVKGGVRGGLTSYEGRLVVVDNERQVHILR
ncbi:MAG: PQQ-binding-like beta-propeller repeat protein, partial [Planctomycetota bacterium]